MNFSYDTITIKAFWKLIYAGDEVVSRWLKIKGIQKSRWERIKSQWELSRMDAQGEALLETRRAALIENIKLKRVAILVAWLRSPFVPEGEIQKVFTIAKIPWVADPEKRDKALSRLLNKHNEQFKIRMARLKQMEPDWDDEDLDEKEPINTGALDQALASLELHGYTVTDYENVTLSRYEAMTAVIKKQIDARERANHR